MNAHKHFDLSPRVLAISLLAVTACGPEGADELSEGLEIQTQTSGLSGCGTRCPSDFCVRFHNNDAIALQCTGSDVLHINCAKIGGCDLKATFNGTEWKILKDNGDVVDKYTPITPVSIVEFDGDQGNDSFSLETPAGSAVALHAWGRAGKDRIRGSNGNDIIRGNAGPDHLYGNGGDDIIHGDGGPDHVYGGNGNDDLYGDAGDDIMEGNQGDDTIRLGRGICKTDKYTNYAKGGPGNDVIYGGDGSDKIQGGDGDDVLYGGGCGDKLQGEHGADSAYGNAGDDDIYGGSGRDLVCDGGPGSDQCQGCDGKSRNCK